MKVHTDILSVIQIQPVIDNNQTFWFMVIIVTKALMYYPAFLQDPYKCQRSIMLDYFHIVLKCY